jgi:hypothetical protein
MTSRAERRAWDSSSLLGVASSAAIVVIAVATAGGHRPPPQQGPFLVLTTAPPSEDASRAAAALALGALSPTRQGTLREQLATLVDRLEARRNPWAVDLDSSPIEAPLSELSASLLPMLTAARALALQRVSVPGQTGSVEVAPRCPKGVVVRCFPVWPNVRDPDRERERARFAVWPLSNALRLRFESAKVAEQTASRLRGCERLPHTALVLTAVDLHGRKSAAADDMRALAARARTDLVRAGEATEMTDLLGEIADSSVAGPLLPWLELSDAEVLVVPKLGALAELGAFEREVRQMTSSASRSPRAGNGAWGSAW